MSKQFKVIDSHIHFSVKGESLGRDRAAYVAEHGEEKWEKLQEMNQFQRNQWKKAWGFPDALGPRDTIEETCGMWIEDMDKKGVDKVVFVTAGDYQHSNDNMARIISYAPDRFIGYAHHDPFDKDGAEKLEYAISQQGLRGIKILGPDLDRPLDDKSLYPLWRVAERHQVPVLFHFGIMGAAGGIMDHVNISPKIIQNVAKAFPDVIFIVPHFGCSKVEDTLFLCWVCPNVYIDTSGSNQWTRWMPYPLTVKDLFKKYYETIGPERILFGTDGSWFPRGFVTEYLDVQLRACVELGFGDEDIANIFSGNIERVLGRYIK